MAETTLSTRTLNRALLDRQMLLERSDQPLTRVIEQMGGIQTQYAPAGYIGLWSRMRDFERPMLTAALEDRRAIQATMMRVTIHTVSADDYWPMLAGILPATRAWLARVHRSELGGRISTPWRPTSETSWQTVPFACASWCRAWKAVAIPHGPSRGPRS